MELSKKKKLGTILATLTIGGSLSACAPSSNNFDPSEKTRLARKVENMITEETFEDAYNEASRIVAQDPSNTRARLWKAALAPSMELRGILMRVKPLASQTPKRKADYDKAVSEFLRTHGPRTVNFFFSGPEDIATESDAQEVVGRITARLDELRQTMKALRNESIVIDGLPNARAVALNTADFDALQQVIAGYQVYISIMNSYDLTGSMTVSENSGRRTGKESLDALLANQQFGKLRDGREYAVIPQLAKDAVVATRAALALQSQLCPQGRPSPSNRPGHLFEEGICLEQRDGLEAALKTVEAVASMNRVVLNLGENNERYVVSAPQFFSTPMQDLRSIVPTSYDACGQAVAIADPSVGGLFPEGEINSKLAEQAQKSCGY